MYRIVWKIEYYEFELLRKYNSRRMGTKSSAQSIHVLSPDGTQPIRSLIAGSKLWSWEVNTQGEDLRLIITWMDRSRKFELSSLNVNRDKFGQAVQQKPNEDPHNEGYSIAVQALALADLQLRCHRLEVGGGAP